MEIDLRKNYLKNETIQTIYLGGGTPSVLSAVEINRIIQCIYDNFNITENPEISLEANPDDLTEQYINELINETPVNRLSIGIQSFIDKQLIWMNRRHTAKEAIKCIDLAQKAGFDNINADLIYGIPGMTNVQWQNNLKTLLDMEVQHISAYHFTIEPDTVFGRRYKKGYVKEADEKLSFQQFEWLLKITGKYNFDHYEISNFAKHNFYSGHNLNYWKQGKYIGIGPSAHSYNGNDRQWNLKVNSKYIDGVNMQEGFFEKEILSDENRFNEYIMLSLRTKWGIDLNYLKNTFDVDFFDHLMKMTDRFIASKHLKLINNSLVFTPKGMFVSDFIFTKLFI